MDVSVIIPAYNAEATIAQAIESALEQTLAPRQVVVIDDGSTDRTASLVSARFPTVLCLRTANGGPSRARNRGLAEASCSWVAFLDADDIWHPEKLRLQAKALAAASDQAIVATAWTRDRPSQPMGALPPTRLITWREIVRQNAFQTSTALLRRQLAFEIGGFRPDFDAAEDWDFWLRASMHSDVLYVDAPLVQYRDVPTGVSKQLWRVYENGIAMLRDWHARHHLLSESEFRHLLAWQHVRFAYNLWREDNKGAAGFALAQAWQDTSPTDFAQVVFLEFLPYLLRRGIRRVAKPLPHGPRLPF